WKALLEIPVGKLSSYKAMAKAVNNPKAVRAVGSAIGDNPVSYIIPCHRVIRSDGGLGGYFWGLEIKKKMIEREAQIAEIEN
ncbi:MAG TPA: methylated-DNA--[protein]-cysteine S-methyltransferase, partial [Porphyromonadaceae bacterium]|nr:methylated-DNA--[protein]-cysteine S-methyltransferase [Porphyromonadaceae bacterium]